MSKRRRRGRGGGGGGGGEEEEQSTQCLKCPFALHARLHARPRHHDSALTRCINTPMASCSCSASGRSLVLLYDEMASGPRSVVRAAFTTSAGVTASAHLKGGVCVRMYVSVCLPFTASLPPSLTHSLTPLTHSPILSQSSTREETFCRGSARWRASCSANTAADSSCSSTVLFSWLRARWTSVCDTSVAARNRDWHRIATVFAACWWWSWAGHHCSMRFGVFVCVCVCLCVCVSVSVCLSLSLSTYLSLSLS